MSLRRDTAGTNDLQRRVFEKRIGQEIKWISEISSASERWRPLGLYATSQPG